jgi:hypothetical protein
MVSWQQNAAKRASALRNPSLYANKSPFANEASLNGPADKSNFKLVVDRD